MCHLGCKGESSVKSNILCSNIRLLGVWDYPVYAFGPNLVASAIFHLLIVFLSLFYFNNVCLSFYAMSSNVKCLFRTFDSSYH